ncbi:MAG: hypothetical protein A2X53_09380 [Candidatus Rokubacteria bacterium GWA2_70_23]|nr:MAG: hypothetical protein A2X53_09380 [Candidatus Rokubacteria bacterium GWA2_70_23]
MQGDLMPRLYVATVGDGLFRSDDLGSSWTKEPGLAASARLYSLCAASGELLVGGEGRIFRYGERAWTELALPVPDTQVWSLAAMDGVILAGTRPLGLFRSDDGGRRWESLSFALPMSGEPQPEARRADMGIPRAERGTPQPHTPRITALLPSPWAAGEVWAGVEVGGVFASADGGRSWSAANEEIPSLDVHGLAWSSGGILLAATPRGVAMWRSARWMEGLFEPADRYCRALATRPDDPGMLYCGFGDGPPGTRGEIALSTDGGRSWRASGMLSDTDSTIWSVATAADAAGLVLACSISGKVFVSLDGCASARPVLTTGFETRAVACLAE